MEATIATYVQSGIILIAGLFVFIIYFLTRKQELRNAARIVYLEIKTSEQVVANIKNSGFATEDTVLPVTNSWEKFSHLFVNKLDSEDYFIIDSYYSSCNKVQEMLLEVRKYHDNAIMEKGIELQRKLIDLIDIKADNPKKAYEEEKEKLLQIVHAETYFFSAHFPKERLNKYISTIRPIIGTTCFDKIKQLAKMK